MSIPLALLKKVRCRFLCPGSGAPVSGIVATLAIGFGESRIPLGSLCSDSTGYVSFDLKPLLDRKVVSADKLLLVSPRLPGGKVNLLDILLKGNSIDGLSAINIVGPAATTVTELGATTVAEPRVTNTFFAGNSPDSSFCLVFPVYISAKSTDDECGKNNCSRTPISSIQSPDIYDYQVSPFSFVTPVTATLGDGSCETLVPSSLPVQEHRFYKVVVRRAEDGTVPNLLGVREVKVTDALVTHKPKLKYAEVLEFKQRWYSLGHSLGEIKYSMALAPGEATQIAIIDWTRQDSISRTDSVFAAEYMDHSLKRDRSIEETIDSALKESQGGSSFVAGTSGTASGNTYGTGMWTGNHAIGGGVSNSWGNRNLEGDSLQDLHDGIRQQTGYTRSLNSTVVVQASQAEQNVLQTRKVANHNHCHALTIQYYEVLRHFSIKTEYSGRKKALLVPFTPFVFTWELALQFRSILEPALIDTSLTGCFDAIFRLKLVPSIYDIQPGPSTTGPPDTGGAGSTDTGGASPANKSKTLPVLGVLGEGVGSGLSVKNLDVIQIDTDASLMAIDHRPGASFQTSNGGHDPADGTFIAPGLRMFSLIFKIGNSGPWRQAGSAARATADRDGEIILGVNDRIGEFGDNKDENGGHDRWNVTVTVPSHEIAPPPPADPTATAGSGSGSASTEVFVKEEDELCVAKLLSHLNGNQGFYNSGVWVLQNPVERRIRIESALVGNSDLLDALDDMPIAVSGNYVAFPYDGPIPGWLDTRPEDPDAPLEDIVTLPTRGLFAEAQLGHCNACEERDPTRMSDWTEMTIETPPDISDVTPGPKGQTPSITPTPLPGNVIQITQPPSAPDPTGLAAALKVIGTPNIFRDMSGLDEVSTLLDTLSRESTEANIKAMAQQAKDKLDQAKNNTGGTNNTGSTRSSASEPDSARQIDRLKAIEYAKDKGLISQEQGTNAAEGVLGGESISSSDTGALGDRVVATINLDKYCTPAVRAFSPGNPFGGKAADKSGRTTLRAVVDNAPAGSTWHWSVATPTAANIISPSGHITQVVAGDPGLTDVTFEARDSGGTSLGKKTVKLSVPQFVVIDEDAAAFNPQLVAYHLDDVKVTLLQKVKQVVDFLLANANVRTIWHLAPFNEVVPAQLVVGGFSAGKFNQLIIHGAPLAPGVVGGTAAPGIGPAKPDESINIYPGGYISPGSDIGVDVATIVAALAAQNMTDPDIKGIWIESMARLLGETMAHEIHHSLLGFIGFDAGGHNSPPIPFDLMNAGTARNWLQRTGIEILDQPNFPKPGSYRDGGAYAISSVQTANQTKVDAVFPVPPAFL